MIRRRWLALLLAVSLLAPGASVWAATIAGTEVDGPWRLQGARVFRWAALANGDTGTWLTLPHCADKTFEAYGTFGAGGAVTVQGTNDPATSSGSITTMTRSSDAAAASLTSSAPFATLIENPLKIRPSVTAGDGTTSLSVTVVCR